MRHPMAAGSGRRVPTAIVIVLLALMLGFGGLVTYLALRALMHSGRQSNWRVQGLPAWFHPWSRSDEEFQERKRNSDIAAASQGEDQQLE